MSSLQTFTILIPALLGLLTPLLETTQPWTSSPFVGLVLLQSNSNEVSNLSIQKICRCYSQYLGYSHRQARPVWSLLPESSF